MADAAPLTAYDEQRLAGYLTHEDQHQVSGGRETVWDDGERGAWWCKMDTCLPDSLKTRLRNCPGAFKIIGGIVAVTLLIALIFAVNSGRRDATTEADDSLPALDADPPLRGIALAEAKKHKEGMAVCEDPAFAKETLKTVYEETFFGLLEDTKGEKKFEASDVRFINNTFWVVADNSWALGHIGRTLAPFSSENIQVGSAKRTGHGDSQWEGLVYDDSKHIMLTVREEIEVEELKKKKLYIPDEKEAKGYRSVIQELTLTNYTGTPSLPHGYGINDECVVDFPFPDANKGLEGAVGLRDKDGELYLLGLCEGNYCKGKDKGRESGHGRMILLKRETKGDDGKQVCYWKTLREIKIPQEAYFADYSAAAVLGDTIAIISQEDSAMWMGKMKLDKNGYIDPKKFEIESKGGKLFNFPRDDSCKIVYCNLEGIAFITPNLLVAVSDKMKGAGRQDFRCLAKDQSLHVFSLPP